MERELMVAVSVGFVAACMMLVYWRRQRGGGGGTLPPSPRPLPIVGNIFQLGLNPHRSLAQLAKTYGPLMSLRLGSQVAVVVSSPEMATKILQKHGKAFSNRFIPDSMRALEHDKVSMTMLPSNTNQWKKLRRITREELFINKALEAGRGLRHERLGKLVDHVSGCCGRGGAMNVGEATFTTMSGLIFATLFSDEFIGYGATDSAPNRKVREHVNGFTRYLGVPNISDFLPILAPFDLQGVRGKMSYHLRSLLEIVEAMIEQRMQARKKNGDYKKKDDFLETLLDLLEGNEYELSIEEIKNLCVDLIIAGSDTSAATAEWGMVELLLHSNKLAKLKAEMKSVLGDKRIVEESDISRLPYLQATVKEVMRYHPIAPLLGPLSAVEETRVDGYTIPKDTRIIVNFWAITRDPSIWKNPECFEPERFLDNNIDYMGQHAELIPFGLGRRICPGMTLASCMVPCMMATLCHNFNWKLEGGVGTQSQQIQREDVFGQALQKKNPLWAIPSIDV